MTSRPARVPTRRLALALSLMLLAGALAVPAAAQTAPGIINPAEGDVFSVGDTLSLEADRGDETTVNWAVRIDDPDRDSSGTKAGNVDGFTDPFELGGSSFTAEVDTSGWEPSDFYFFVFNWGDPSDDDTREVVQFTIDDPFGDFEEDEIRTCDGNEDCTITAEDNEDGNNYTVSTSDPQPKPDGATPRIGLRLGGEDELTDKVREACTGLIDEEKDRLGPAVVHLVPDGFAEGADLTVTSVIPESYVQDRDNQPKVRSRGNGAFQVCIAPTEDEVDIYEDAGYEGDLNEEIGHETGLFGPILLENCEDEDQTACVESRNRADNDLTEEKTLNITYRIPAVDPWMM